MTDDRSEWQRHIGVGERSNAFARHGDTRVRKVIAEEGPRRGKVAGTQTDHKDGRLDAHVYMPPVVTAPRLPDGIKPPKQGAS